MPTPLDNALTRIGEKVPNVGTDELTSAQKTANLLQALAEYSRHIPYVKVSDTAADGSYEYALPADWESDFSELKSVEYPAGETQDPADAIIAPEKYGVYRTSSTRKLRFYEITPAAGYIIRVQYTLRHTITSSASTVYTNDFDAVMALAAAYCCFDLARRYAQDNESFIAADAVNRRDKASKYEIAGKGLVKEFAVHFNLDKTADVAPASTAKNLDLSYPDKIEFLTHPSEER